MTLGEVHHVASWAEGGPTSVENGVVLCWHHHDLVHRRRQRIARIGGAWVFRTADGQLVEAGASPPEGAGAEVSPPQAAGRSSPSAGAVAAREGPAAGARAAGEGTIAGARAAGEDDEGARGGQEALWGPPAVAWVGPGARK